MAARASVGIDLGTTNTVVAWAPADGGETRVLAIDQLVGARQAERVPLLPSSLYAPVEGEGVDDPFGDAPWVVGEHARRRGAEVLGRLVSSSKSWLVHAGVDRSAAILPWGAAEDAPRLSPVDAAARVLAHVKRVWDVEHADAPLAEQDVVLTVPASFDEVARELTLEAAGRAGLAPKLLEEPQAAFYDWMTRSGRPGIERLLARTDGEALVLVVDVGGGTTDLSLVRVSGVDKVERVAVGPHLLLGGDNMDLALAHAAEPRLVDEGRLEPARFAQLVAGCRVAKEALLGEAPPEDAPVTVTMPGAKLVGATRTARIARDEAERIVLEGFLPLVPADARPQRARGALVAFGLPYERDVAITRHVAAFLARHLPAGSAPNAVLLNGGVFRASRIAGRLVEALGEWRGHQPVERLPDADPDLAVARGAVAYALARRGRGVRIGGGSARGYFVGVADEGRQRAVCIVPRGAEEGVAHTAPGRTFALAVGRPVRFDLFASDEVEAHAGEVVDVDDDRYGRLPPVATTIAGARGEEVRVALEGELTPLGTLDLACVEVDTPERRHRLAFHLRGSPAPSVAPSRPPAASQPPRKLDAARELVDRAFGKPRADAGGREAKDLLRELDRVLGERSQWTTETNRALYDALLPDARGRRRSADHERVFWLLAGWCVRPGFGDPLDPQRLALLAPLFDERLAFPGEARGWQQFWIAWRRAAGGLDDAMQARVRDFVDPWLAPAEAGLKKPKKPALALDDALDMACSLERVAQPRRSALGGWVLERTWTDRDPRLWTAVGRLGARVPAYASVHHVVAPHVVERWLDHLLREKWDVVPTAAQAAVRMARRTGDRARDVAERVRKEVEQRLERAGADAASIRAVREVVAVEESERAAFFGDALPQGLRLVD
ncbi:MAG TPA: Hsp70 family protein [Polyangiaceae bacterium]|jgi:molecular chaperone DnaK (HSP70)